MTIETSTVTLPAFLAPALINGDISSIEDSPDDLETFERALAHIAGWNITLDSGAEPFFSDSSDIGDFAGDVLEFTLFRTKTALPRRGRRCPKF